MNLDDLTKVWRSQDLSPLYGVDKNMLHQMLQQEQATEQKQFRRMRRFMYIVSAFLLITAALFLAIMIDPYDDDVLVVWDYVIGVVGVASAITLAGALLALRRSHLAREQAFGDSLRDHVRRRIAQLDEQWMRERRLGLVIMAAGIVAAAAITIGSYRINDKPYSEFHWSPFPSILILALFGWLIIRALRRERRERLPRKRQLEALLKELEGEDF